MVNISSSYEAKARYRDLMDSLRLSITALTKVQLLGEPLSSYISFPENRFMTYQDGEQTFEALLTGLHWKEEHIIVLLDDGTTLELASISYDDLLFFLKELETGNYTIYTPV